MVSLAVFLSLHVEGQGMYRKLSVEFSAGRQVEDFNWSIAGNINGQSPDVLSELKWTSVSGVDYSGSLQWNFWKNLVVIAAYNRVSVGSGKVSDRDFAGDNRTQATYNENFSDNKGHVSALYAGAGYIFFDNTNITLSGFAGYSTNRQSLYITDESGRFPDLNSTYSTHWDGAFLKAESSVKILRALSFVADLTYNQVNYKGQGNWNLINEFQHPVSYRHSAKGYGLEAGGNLVFDLDKCISLRAGYRWFKWETGNGIDELYLSSGEVDKTQLNGVYRNGHLLSCGIIISL